MKFPFDLYISDGIIIHVKRLTDSYLKNYRLRFLLLMALFGCMGPIVRAIGWPSEFIACMRAWVAAVVLAAFALITKKNYSGAEIKKVLPPMLVSGLCLAGDWIGLFESYNYTTIAAATVCYYMTPVIVFALSPVVLGERFTLRHVICTVTAFAGMVLVSGVLESGAFSVEDIKGVLFALLGAVSYATIILINKRFPAGDPMLKTIIQLGTAAVLTTPYVLLNGSAASAVFSLCSVAFMLILGVCFTALTYIRYFDLIIKNPAKTVSILSYADPVVAVFISVILLGEPISLPGIIGSVMIIAAAIISEVKKQ